MLRNNWLNKSLSENGTSISEVPLLDASESAAPIQQHNSARSTHRIAHLRCVRRPATFSSPCSQGPPECGRVAAPFGSHLRKSKRFTPHGSCRVNSRHGAFRPRDLAIRLRSTRRSCVARRRHSHEGLPVRHRYHCPSRGYLFNRSRDCTRSRVPPLRVGAMLILQRVPSFSPPLRFGHFSEATQNAMAGYNS